MRQHPPWLKKSFSKNSLLHEVRSIIADLRLSTVCDNARCPNIGECFSSRELTFLILGDICTRRCRFCAIDSGCPNPPEEDEPYRIAEAVRRLGLQHIVISSVSRDDLPDEGALQFIKVVRAVRDINAGVTVEVLVPDFHSREDLVSMVIEEGRPDVFAHNIETVERLSGLLRPQANYRCSLKALSIASLKANGEIIKSGIMVGLGETYDELKVSFDDLLRSGVTHLTIGQYLRPSADQVHVVEYISPEHFGMYEQLAYKSGFLWVRSGPFVRSSYHAAEVFHRTNILAEGYPNAN